MDNRPKAQKEKENQIGAERKETPKKASPRSIREYQQREDASRSTVDLPPWISREAWAGFVEMRQVMHKQKKVPWTPRAEKIALSKLAEFHAQGYDCNAILDEAVLKGWRGLWISSETPRLQIQGVPAFAPSDPNRSRIISAIEESQRTGRSADEILRIRAKFGPS